MPRQCILHVGMHKTGSTSIQYTLHRNPSLRGATYLDLGVPNASGPVARAFGQPARVSPGSPPPDPQQQLLHARRCREQLEQSLAQAGERSVLSAEDICHLEPEQAADLRRTLEAHVQDVAVLAYVREARGYMESMFQQHLKGGGRGLLLLPPQYPRYRFCLAKFDRLFGRDRVTLVPFRSALFPQGCVVRDFCQRTGLEVDERTIKRANEGMSRNAAGLLQNYRLLLGQDLGWVQALDRRLNAGLRVNRYLVSWFMQVDGPKLRFAPELLAPFFETKREDLDWIAERLGQRMDALGEAGADDVRSNDDLLTLDAGTLDWLGRRSGVVLPAGARGEALRPAFERLRRQAIDQVVAEGPGVPPVKVSALPT